MTCRPVERGACVIDLHGPICVPHMNCSLDDIAPVWALACVIRQSLKERGEVGTSRHVNVADGHSFPDSVRFGQLLRQFVHGILLVISEWVSCSLYLLSAMVRLGLWPRFEHHVERCLGGAAEA